MTGEKQVFRGRGVYYLPGCIPCPLAGVGERGERLSNRLALDDDHSLAVFDPEARRLRVSHSRPCARKAMIGDLILLGTGETCDGRTVPLAFHTRFDKKGDRFLAQPHLHPSVSAGLISARCEPLEVIMDNGRRETVVLNRERLEAAWRDPPLPERLGRALIQVRDLSRMVSAAEAGAGTGAGGVGGADAGAGAGGAGTGVGAEASALVDLRVSIGLGPFSKPAVRVQLLPAKTPGMETPHAEARVALPADATPAALSADSTLGALFRSGAWELRVTALFSLPSAEQHVRRALFLFGMEGIPLLDRLSRAGLRRGETLAFRFGEGRGTVRLGQDAVEVPRAADVARAYLEYDFLGAILAQRIRDRLGSLRTASQAPGDALVI